RLLARLTAEDATTVDDNISGFVSLLSINRHMYIVIDSDKSSSEDEINATKSRIVEEFERAGGGVWVTAGREIENYVPSEVFITAFQQTQKRAAVGGDFAQFDDFAKLTVGPQGRIDKVGVAEAATAGVTQLWDRFDLISQVGYVVSFIRAAN